MVFGNALVSYVYKVLRDLEYITLTIATAISITDKAHFQMEIKYSLALNLDINNIQIILSTSDSSIALKLIQFLLMIELSRDFGFLSLSL